MTRILVPTDFSEPSLAAVRSGIELADAVVSSSSSTWSRGPLSAITSWVASHYTSAT
jgi:hypothetical protein